MDVDDLLASKKNLLVEWLTNISEGDKNPVAIDFNARGTEYWEARAKVLAAPKERTF